MERRNYIWLLVAATLLIFANGKWVIPLAAWLAPLFLIRFLRTQPVGRGVALGALAHGIAFYLWYDGVIIGALPLPKAAGIAVVAVLSLVQFLPYVADRLLFQKLPGFAATFVFPLSLVALEYFNAVFDPMGSWGALAYTQTENLPLLQLAAVTGMWGISFLIAWFAGVGNWVWAIGPAASKRGAVLYGAVLSAVLLAGGLRLALFDPVGIAARRPDALIGSARQGPAALPTVPSTVRIAALNGYDYRYGAPTGRSEDWKAVDDLLQATVREARAGAKIVVWAEANAILDPEGEPELIRRAAAVAKEQQIYLLISPYLEHPGARDENKSVMLTPQGEVGWQYWKNNANDLENTVRGDGQVARLQTPYGLIASATCWDLDFPAYVRQVGRLKADMLLAPSADWRQIDPMHTRMAVMRAVENGASLVRQTRSGLSGAYDYTGRPLAAMDSYLAHDQTLVAQVPIRGVRTVYAVVGDLFAWADVAAWLGLVAWVFLRTRRRPLGADTEAA